MTTKRDDRASCLADRHARATSGDRLSWPTTNEQGMSTHTEPVDVVEIPIAKWRQAYDDETGMASMPALLEHLQRALVRLSRQSLTLALLVTEISELNDEDCDEPERAELLHQI